MTHLATVTIDADQVAADLTDFVVTIDLSDLPTEFWSTVADGGGDIRCYKSDGTTELAREVVFCDQSTDTGVIHVKYTGTLSSSVDTEIQIHGDGTSSEPAVTATYGRNNVWTGYEFVLHLNQSGTDSADEFIDSTGNALHGTGENNSGNDTTANHPFGGVWQLLNGTNSRIDVGGSAGCVDGAGFTVQAIYRATSVGSDAGLITDDRNTTGDDLAITVADTGTEGGQYKVRAAGTFKVDRGSTRAVANTNYWAALVYDGTARTAKGYLQGVEDASSTNTGTSYTGVDDFWIGDYYNGNYDFPGYIGEAKASTTKYSANWLLTEYRNQSSTTTFYTATAAGGGGVSGTGDLVGAGSEVTGTGERTITGTGALEGQGAQVVGTATRTVTGTGVLVGQGSDVAGTGATGGTHTGVGDLVAAGSEIVGVGERTVTGTGALVAQGSAVAGVGERTVTGSGDLVGAGAEVSGSGAIGGITTGTGDLVGAGSEVVGTGLRTVTGSGALVAQGSAVTGTGERTVTGAGALVGSGSEIVGAGVGGDVTTGAGALVGQGSAVTGTGTRTITGVGDLVAAGSIIVGSGLRTVTGSGALVGAGSAVTGSSAHAFVAGNTRRTWLLSPRGREWSLSRSN